MEEEVKKYFEMTCNIAGIRLAPRDQDLFIALFAAVQEKEGDLTVKEIMKIFGDVEQKHNPTQEKLSD